MFKLNIYSIFKFGVFSKKCDIGLNRLDEMVTYFDCFIHALQLFVIPWKQYSTHIYGYCMMLVSFQIGAEHS